jgi:hypothetical protein
MPSFIAALATIIIVSVGASLVLNTVQEPVDVAFATSGARVDHVE